MENDILKPGKKLDPETRKAVIAQIAKGEEDNRKIAAEMGVSAKTVAMIRRYAQGEINLAAGKRIDGTPEPGRVAGEQCAVDRAPHPSPAAPATPLAAARSGRALVPTGDNSLRARRLRRPPEGEGSGKLTDHYPPDTDHCASGETVPMTIRMDGGGTRTVRISKETAEMIKRHEDDLQFGYNTTPKKKTADEDDMDEVDKWAVDEELWLKEMNHDRILDLAEEMHRCLREQVQLRPKIVEEYNRRVCGNGEA